MLSFLRIIESRNAKKSFLGQLKIYGRERLLACAIRLQDRSLFLKDDLYGKVRKVEVLRDLA